MAGFRDPDDSRLPDGELFILSAGGSQEPGSTVPPAGSSGRPRMSTARRVGILLGVVAVFAFGVMVGRSTRTGQPGVATSAPATTVAGPTRSPAVTPGAISTAAGRPTGPPEATTSTFAQVTGTCGGPVYVAQVGYVSPLPTPIDVTILAGTDPREYDLRDGTVGPPLAKLSQYQYVSNLATDDHGTVLAVTSCTNPMTASIIRVTGNGDTSPVAVPPGWRTLGGLVDVDGRIWAVLDRAGGGTGDRLIATDGSGDTMAPPPGARRVGTSTAVSPDGSRTATVTADPDDEPGYHVKVTDAATGRTTTVPGIRLGAAGASVAFSPDSRWLVVAVPTLAGGRILLYGPRGLQGPYSISGTLQGPLIGGIPIAVSGS